MDPRNSKMTAARQQIEIWLVLALLLVLARPALAQENQVSESDLKAAFLFNFTKFIDWPANAFPSETASIEVGVYGDEEFTRTLHKLLAEKKAHARGFNVRRLASIHEATNCHILFFRLAETRKMGVILDSIKRRPILTVGESSEFLDLGGMINLYFEDKQLRFDVNSPAAEDSKLTISSKLLRLARKTRRGGAK